MQCGVVDMSRGKHLKRIGHMPHARRRDLLLWVVEHMQNTYDGGAMVSNVALAPKGANSHKADHSTVFLALKNPSPQPNLHGDTHDKWGSREPLPKGYVLWWSVMWCATTTIVLCITKLQCDAHPYTAYIFLPHISPPYLSI